MQKLLLADLVNTKSINLLFIDVDHANLLLILISIDNFIYTWHDWHGKVKHLLQHISFQQYATLYYIDLRNCPKVRYNLQLHVIRGDYNIIDKQVYISIHMHQSIPPAPSPPPPPPSSWPPDIGIFGCQIPGGGDFWAVKFPRVGTKKEDKLPVLRQHCNIFHWLHSRIALF